MMANKLGEGNKMASQLKLYQVEQIENIEQWYGQFYDNNQHYHIENPFVVRYMVLWAIFNALYNVADLPNNKIRGVSKKAGKTIPHIRGRKESGKIKHIARQMATDSEFVQNLYKNHEAFCRDISTRHPPVTQPPDIQELRFEIVKEKDDQEYVIALNDIRGVASLDSRKFLEDGSVVFQYRSLELTLDDDGNLSNPEDFIEQLLFVLYQIRNNIAHGGSAAFFMGKKRLAEQAMFLLEDIVQYLFGHSELLLVNEDD